MPILKTEELTKRFGGLLAVDEVNLTVEEGTIHSIIGPNGAGKTTFFNLLCGLIEPDSGSVTYRGTDITGMPFHRVARHGIGRSFQRTQIFADLTTLENVRVAAQTIQKDRLNPFRVPKATDQSYENSYRVLDFVGLSDRADEKSDVLSHGEQRALDVGIALATAPSLLLLDEPTSGMSASEVDGMTGLVNRLRTELGITILLIEHNVNLVMNISDLITVLHVGQVIAQGPPEEIRMSKEVSEAYLGTSEDA